MKEFIIFHQPKTAGTFASRSLPPGYVLPHSLNYNFCLNNNLVKDKQELVCIARNPIDYYISLIIFWCIDPKWCSPKSKGFEVLKKEFDAKQKDFKTSGYAEAHPGYFLSEGYQLDFVPILQNLFDESFLDTHSNVLSKKFHTYDYYVFREMARLDIGFYTFSFLDQYSSKKITDIKTNEECLSEIQEIKKTFTIFKTSTISSDLESICKKHGINFTHRNSKDMSSNREGVSESSLPKDLVEKIKHKDRHIFNELF